MFLVLILHKVTNDRRVQFGCFSISHSSTGCKGDSTVASKAIGEMEVICSLAGGATRRRG
ncbi:uncharacterized protein N7500_000605 [Penicillium coprophilum]|uniref:uncharacterized protein n=1 Tax=Penicillium coprophilum TaxID=36646 RepID=UPI00239DE87D|nr:uncharacterized protein N7500_000605 [Penicillium coprophilum]KAJ5177906.1 hypothetical protein N7500_000605 [Penicillium coprophilum]